MKDDKIGDCGGRKVVGRMLNVIDICDGGIEMGWRKRTARQEGRIPIRNRITPRESPSRVSVRQGIHQTLPVSILKKGEDFLIAAVGEEGDEGRDGGSQIVDSISRRRIEIVPGINGDWERVGFLAQLDS